MNRQLVILAAGVGGLSSIRELAEIGVPLDDVDITIVDEGSLWLQRRQTGVSGHLAALRCPVAPYEGAMLATDLLRDKGSRDATRIAIYSPEKHPMPAAGPYAGFELIDLLKDNEIEFFGEHAVKRIEPDRQVVHFENGRTVEFDWKACSA